MTEFKLAIKATGLVTSVGLSAAASCAAIRAKLSNPIQTAFVNALAEPIVGHEVPLEIQWRGRYRLIHLAAMALEECAADLGPDQLAEIPLFLCAAEAGRPGGEPGLDDSLLAEICDELEIEFGPQSEVIALGRVGVAYALARCRAVIQAGVAPLALVIGVDSLLREETLDAYDAAQRLLTDSNSNGFLPGEGAGAILVGRPGGQPELRCTGLGFATEQAHVDSELPLRGDGIAGAVRAALNDAGCGLHDIDYRIADVSGEHYYFKEAALLVGRLARGRRAENELWHPAECIGETGALAGVAMVVVAEAAARRGYAPGRRVLAHFSSDHGERAAAVFEYGGS
ncbi:MAG: beta-ketoacyl synthase N-terminal-like domain-containing protein [Vicinamibacterales bacterium]